MKINDKSAVNWLRKNINNALIGEIPLHSWDSLQCLFTEAEKMENERISSKQGKEQQKQLITEIMDLDAKDGLYDTVNDTVNDVDADFPIEHKLASVWVFDTNASKWSNNDDTAGDNHASFIAGYKKAQETLYTEEDMLNAFYTGYLSKDLIWELAKKLFKESLKQPKKD